VAQRTTFPRSRPAQPSSRLGSGSGTTERLAHIVTRPYPDAPTGDADGYVDPAYFPQLFARHVPAATAARMTATQRPAATAVRMAAAQRPAATAARMTATQRPVITPARDDGRAAPGRALGASGCSCVYSLLRSTVKNKVITPKVSAASARLNTKGRKAI
jgi:hypothetical protein